VGYKVEFTESAAVEASRLDFSMRSRVANKLHWLAENAEVVIHHPLTGLPPDLVGLCKLRIGDYRVLYYCFKDQQLLMVAAVAHRSVAYDWLHQKR
jgi:mRNA-degrading endonuclease RelE of RelBE toxin-antitoxin system